MGTILVERVLDIFYHMAIAVMFFLLLIGLICLHG